MHAVCQALIQKFLDTVVDDADSPLRACSIEELAVAGGRIHRRDDPGAGETYTDILARHRLDELTADGESTPPDPQQTDVALAGPFAAKFVEVRIDAELGLLRVARIVSVVDAGRIFNEKLARSQIIGGTVGGIGQAIFEETITDAEIVGDLVLLGQHRPGDARLLTIAAQGADQVAFGRLVGEPGVDVVVEQRRVLLAHPLQVLRADCRACGDAAVAGQGRRKYLRAGGDTVESDGGLADPLDVPGVVCVMVGNRC
ncbi:MAG: molybdopterin cofactor-binding domain-containing protein [Pseudonocardiaceae bacterium]